MERLPELRGIPGLADSLHDLLVHLIEVCQRIQDMMSVSSSDPIVLHREKCRCLARSYSIVLREVLEILHAAFSISPRRLSKKTLSQKLQAPLTALLQAMQEGERFMTDCRNTGDNWLAEKALHLLLSTEVVDVHLHDLLWCFSVINCAILQALGGDILLSHGDLSQEQQAVQDRNGGENISDALSDIWGGLEEAESEDLSAVLVFLDNLMRADEGLGETSRLANFLSRRLLAQNQMGMGLQGMPNDEEVPAYLWADPEDLETSHDHEAIGRHAYAVVYTTKWLGGAFATKDLFHVAADSSVFNNESTLQATLRHPNLQHLVCYMRNPSKNKCHLVMELMSQDLRSLLHHRRKSGLNPPFPLLAAVDLILQLAKGMEYLHAMNVMHRNLKSSNVLVSPSWRPSYLDTEGHGRVKIADFGLSRTKVASFFTTLHVGTFPWRAPEVFDNEAEVEPPARYSKKADVYSFAMVCFEICTGQLPFEGYSRRHHRKRLMEGARPKLPSYCPQTIAAYIENCWHWNPDERPTFKQICTMFRYFKACILLADTQGISPSFFDGMYVNSIKEQLKSMVQADAICPFSIPSGCKITYSSSMWHRLQDSLAAARKWVFITYARSTDARRASQTTASELNDAERDDRPDHYGDDMPTVPQKGQLSSSWNDDHSEKGQVSSIHNGDHNKFFSICNDDDQRQLSSIGNAENSEKGQYFSNWNDDCTELDALLMMSGWSADIREPVTSLIQVCQQILKELALPSDPIILYHKQCQCLARSYSNLLTKLLKSLHAACSINCPLFQKTLSQKIFAPLAALHHMMLEGERFFNACRYQGEQWLVVKVACLVLSPEVVDVHLHDFVWCVSLINIGLEQALSGAGHPDCSALLQEVQNQSTSKEIRDMLSDIWGAHQMAETEDLNAVQKFLAKIKARKKGQNSRVAEFLLRRFSAIPVIAGGNTPNDLVPTYCMVDPKDFQTSRRDAVGRGGYGAVYITEWLGGQFAMKYFRDVSADETMFAREAGLQARFRHSNIVPLVCCTEDTHDNARLVMELMDQDLWSLIIQRKQSGFNPPFSQLVAVDLMLQIAKAMDYLHDRDIIHRDLNCVNILASRPHASYLDKTGHVLVKVADFGISMVKRTSSLSTSKKVDTSRSKTPDISPAEEKMEGEPKLNAKHSKEADVCSFGVVCFEILTGKQPFEGGRKHNEHKKRLIREGVRPQLPPNCPTALAACIERCWHKDPKERPTFKQICTMLRYFKACILLGDAEGLPPSLFNAMCVDRNIEELHSNEAHLLYPISIPYEMYYCTRLAPL